MCQNMEKIVEENEALKAKLKTEEEARVLASRVKALTDKGYSEDEAKAEVEVLKALDDDTFAIVIKRFEDKTEAAQEPIAPKADSLDDSQAEVEIENEEEQENKAAASVDSEDAEMTARASRIKTISAELSQNKGDK